jgi:Family of unknown function (DUF5675)
MELHLERLFSDPEATLGVLLLESKAQCFTLEDQHQRIKVPGETRIPAGRYRLKLRSLGESPHFDKRYTEKFGAEHRGMIEICDVTGFTAVLIHIGNTDADTRGCVLVGMRGDAMAEPKVIGTSEIAYRRLYQRLSTILNEGQAWLTVLDRD